MYFSVEIGLRTHRASFTLGEESSEESDAEIEHQSVAVQTDNELPFVHSVQSKPNGPLRSLEECVEILRSDVCLFSILIVV